jgi:hypothetical protein
MYRFIFVALAVALVACSDSTAPRQLGVAGQWIYRVDQLSDGGQVSCSMTSQDTLTLSRSEGKVAGNYAGGMISCRGKDTETIRLIGGAVVNGAIDSTGTGGQAVSFDFDGKSYHHSGMLAGDEMTGTLTVDHGFPGKLGTVHLTGTWSARRRAVIPPKPQPK